MNAYIKALSYALPASVLNNKQLIEEFPEWSVEKIASKIGVQQRHIAANNETAGDLAEQAATNLFKEWDINREEIDFVLFCTQSPDHFLPTTACILQHKLDIPISAGALDYNLGCSGYIYGLAVAKGLISAGIAKNILLLTGETYSKYMHPKDKGNRTIFGDAASATLVSDSGFAKIGEFTLGSDGAGANNLMVKNGAMRSPNYTSNVQSDENGAIKSDDHLYMNGAEIFSFTQKMVPIVVNQVLEKNRLNKDELTLSIFHQANKYMLNFLRKKIKLPKDKFYVHMENVGNTVSNTIPIALKEALLEKKLNTGDSILLVGFGVGYSWGACVITIS